VRLEPIVLLVKLEICIKSIMLTFNTACD